jgi:hypothetical protein
MIAPCVVVREEFPKSFIWNLETAVAAIEFAGNWHFGKGLNEAAGAAIEERSP